MGPTFLSPQWRLMNALVVGKWELVSPRGPIPSQPVPIQGSSRRFEFHGPSMFYSPGRAMRSSVPKNEVTCPALRLSEHARLAHGGFSWVRALACAATTLVWYQCMYMYLCWSGNTCSDDRASTKIVIIQPFNQRTLIPYVLAVDLRNMLIDFTQTT